MKKNILLFLSLFACISSIYCQTDSIEKSDEEIRLFLDCADCDEAYFMNQLPYVKFVRDAENSDIHLFVNKQKNASEGFRYYLNFVGREKFSSIHFKLQTDSPVSESNLSKNDRLIKTTQMGLAPYVSQTSTVDKISLSCNDSVRTISKSAKDPWNFWVFVLDLGGSLDAEYSLYNYKTEGVFSCKRITDKWKYRLVMDYSYENETYDYRTNATKQSVKKAYTIHSRAVYAITPHWSAQVSGAFKQDTYYNYDFYWDLGPAVEYNFFPWDKSDRKVLAAIYQVKTRFYDYIQPTINNYSSDYIWNQTLSLEFILREKWGNIESMLYYETYFTEPDMYKLGLSTQISIKVARGFSFFVNGKGALINDQHYLPKEASTLTDRLLQARQEETPFEFSGQVGIRYAFGSIYNSVVNHRF